MSAERRTVASEWAEHHKARPSLVVGAMQIRAEVTDDGGLRLGPTPYCSPSWPIFLTAKEAVDFGNWLIGTFWDAP